MDKQRYRDVKRYTEPDEIRQIIPRTNRDISKQTKQKETKETEKDS